MVATLVQVDKIDTIVAFKLKLFYGANTIELKFHQYSME